MKSISELILARIRRRTITSDLTRGLVLMASFALMLVGLFSTYLTVARLEADLNTHARDTSTNLAKILSVPLWTLDIQSVQKIGETFKQSDSTMVYIAIFDEEGHTLYTARKPEPDPIASQATVFYNNLPIGHVELAFSKQEIRASELNSFLTTMLGILLMILTIRIGTSILLQRFLNRPIEDLTRGIDTIANGHNYLGLKPVPQQDINAIILRVNAMGQQIGERLDDLQKASSRYRAFISASNTGAWEYDAQSGFIWCSPEYFSMLGRDVGDYEMTGARNIEQAWLELLHPDDRDRAWQHFLDYLDHPQGMWEQTYRMLHSDGHWVWVWSRGKTLSDLFGLSTSITVGTHIDISEIKTAAEWKEALFEIANAANSNASMDGLFRSIHRSISRLLAADNFYIAIYDAEKDEISFPFYVDQYDQPFPAQKPGRGVTEYILRTGQPVHAPADVFDRMVEQGEVELCGTKSVDWLGVPLQSNLKTIGVMVVQSYDEKVRFGQRELDILSFVSSQVAMVIERKKAEEQILRLNAGLEQRVNQRTASLQAANQEMESFAYSVSHDLRAPLRTLDGFSAFLLSDYSGQLDEEGQDYLHRIQEAARRMGQLINDLLNLSRITRAELDYRPVNLTALAREIAADLQAQYPQRRAVDWQISEGLVDEGDPNLLRIALENLINNAFKFTSRLEQVKIEVGMLDQAGERVYFVRDNGTGFNMAYAGKLFGPFQRLHGAKEYPGTGIGLSIVQRIITRHGGRIWPESEPGKGSTFYFTLGGS